MAQNMDETDEPRRQRGRPRKLPEVRDSAADPIPVRRGRATAIGRDGKIVSRKLSGTVDKFDLRALGISAPEGWTYEWKRKTLAGMEDVDHVNGLMENGWTSVPADRHVSSFNFKSRTGEIVRDGMMLMERPVELTQEARMEERMAARDQINAQNAQYRARLPGGMSGEHPGVQQNVRTTYEPGSPDLRPSYQVAPES